MTASANATFTIVNPAATGVSFQYNNNLTGAPGEVIAQIFVAPAAWTGTLAVGNSSYALGPSSTVQPGYAGSLVVGATAVAPGNYSVPVTASP